MNKKKKVLGEGIVYASSKEAGIATGKTPAAIHNRILQDTFPNWMYYEDGDVINVVPNPKRVRPNQKQVLIDSVLYDNMGSAAEVLDLSYPCLHCRMGNPNFPNFTFWQEGDSLVSAPGPIKKVRQKKVQQQQVLVDSVLYKNAAVASRELGIGDAQIRIKINSERFQNYTYWKDGDSLVSLPPPKKATVAPSAPKPNKIQKKSKPTMQPIPASFSKPKKLKKNKMDEYSFLVYRNENHEGYPAFNMTEEEWELNRHTLLHEHLYGYYDENNNARE